MLPNPFHCGADLLVLAKRQIRSIAGLMRRNERHWRTDAQIDAGLRRCALRSAGRHTQAGRKRG